MTILDERARGAVDGVLEMGFCGVCCVRLAAGGGSVVRCDGTDRILTDFPGGIEDPFWGGVDADCWAAPPLIVGCLVLGDGFPRFPWPLGCEPRAVGAGINPFNSVVSAMGFHGPPNLDTWSFPLALPSAT